MNESPDRISVRGFFQRKRATRLTGGSLTLQAEYDSMSVRSTATDRRTHVQRTVLQQGCDDIGGDRQGQNAE